MPRVRAAMKKKEPGLSARLVTNEGGNQSVPSLRIIGANRASNRAMLCCLAALRDCCAKPWLLLQYEPPEPELVPAKLAFSSSKVRRKRGRRRTLACAS